MVVVIFFRHIALVVYEMVNSSSLGRVSTRKVLEIKAFFSQLLFTGKAFPTRIQLLQNIMVARQYAIDFPNHIDLLVGLFVVVAVAARVAAKLLVDTPNDGFTAVEAFSFFHSYQLFSCSVKTGR